MNHLVLNTPIIKRQIHEYNSHMAWPEKFGGRLCDWQKPGRKNGTKKCYRP
jgi:hypothetical protein